jgi:hypothetical protein
MFWFADDLLVMSSWLGNCVIHLLFRELSNTYGLHLRMYGGSMETSTVHNEVSYLHQGTGYFWTINDKASSTYSVGLRGY